jgi:hypothetical protein
MSTEGETCRRTPVAALASYQADESSVVRAMPAIASTISERTTGASEAVIGRTGRYTPIVQHPLVLATPQKFGAGPKRSNDDQPPRWYPLRDPTLRFQGISESPAALQWYEDDRRRNDAYRPAPAPDAPPPAMPQPRSRQPVLVHPAAFQGFGRRRAPAEITTTADPQAEDACPASPSSGAAAL